MTFATCACFPAGLFIRNFLRFLIYLPSYRFAFGPKLMSRNEEDDDEENHPSGDGFTAERQPLLDDFDYTIHVEGVPHDPNAPPKEVDRLKSSFSKILRPLEPVLKFFEPAYTFLSKFANPPLVGGILAVVFGLIPPLHLAFFGKNSPLEQTFTTSIDNLGNLYTVLQMLVLGSKLKSKKCVRFRPFAPSCTS